MAAVAVPIGHPDGEVMDEAKSNEDADEGGLQENKNVVLQLISKLKLGMDLTKVREIIYHHLYFFYPYTSRLLLCNAENKFKSKQ